VDRLLIKGREFFTVLKSREGLMMMVVKDRWNGSIGRPSMDSKKKKKMYKNKIKKQLLLRI
jgi:hypothetical protein